MAVEIEAKIKVAGLAEHAARLRELGANERGRAVQQDAFFDRPDGSLRSGDEGLRLRQECGSSVLCYKGSRQGGRYKAREEIQFTVSDAEQGRAFLEALGFEATLAFEKRRWLWELQGCQVCLDEVVELGTFVEVEGPSAEQVGKVLETLGLKDADHITRSYVTLLGERLTEQGRANRGEWFLRDEGE